VIEEVRLIIVHLEALEAEMMQMVEHAREGQMLTSIPGIGPLQAAILMALIGNIANVERPGQLKSYGGFRLSPNRARRWIALGFRHAKHACSNQRSLWQCGERFAWMVNGPGGMSVWFPSHAATTRRNEPLLAEDG
jgi:hypothetical protein